MSINESLLQMPKKLYDSENKVLRRVGTVVKKNVERFLHDSDIEKRAKEVAPSNYDGSYPYMHMKDDVNAKVKKDKLGIKYVSIGGGRLTGYKWHLLDQGHLARDGTTFVPGTNFIGRALSASEGEIEKSIDEMVKKVIE